MTTTTTTATRSTTRPDFDVDSNNHHSFSTIPMFDFKWGSQRHLRCVNHPPLLTPSAPASTSPLRKRRSSSSDVDDNEGGIEAVTKKLMLDFCAEVDELQSAFLNSGKHSSPAATADGTAASSESRPWNLCSNPNGHISGGRYNSSPGRNSDDVVGGEKPKRRKFAVSLTKKEIEMDFVAMTGARPAKRPKKRAKSVQKQIDAMSPGFWLTEIRANMYKVNEEQPDATKR
ncbi:hypothetical protein RND81_11G061900 [Saponaria officinalis]|uniref:Uncharacterized protein n=1 Tax=Saponaria officinalis TaxID=3572 RepID=A0AAW1HIG1_SAPOF